MDSIQCRDDGRRVLRARPGGSRERGLQLARVVQFAMEEDLNGLFSRELRGRLECSKVNAPKGPVFLGIQALFGDEAPAATHSAPDGVESGTDTLRVGSAHNSKQSWHGNR